jgi:hypothetical protein
LPFAIQGWSDFKVFFRCVSSGRIETVADHKDPLLPWVFPYIRPDFISQNKLHLNAHFLR